MKTMTTEMMLDMLKSLVCLDKEDEYYFAANHYKFNKKYNKQYVKEELIKWLSSERR